MESITYLDYEKKNVKNSTYRKCINPSALFIILSWMVNSTIPCFTHYFKLGNTPFKQIGGGGGGVSFA